MLYRITAKNETHMRTYFKILTLALLIYVKAPSVYAQNTQDDDQLFRAWIDNVIDDARARGISEDYLDALTRITPDPKIIELASRQPEYIRPIWEYLAHMITTDRLQKGRVKINNNPRFLTQMENKYGVPRGVLIAIWGMETNYGTFKGHFPVLQALATLGYKGRRAKFGHQQIHAALDILQTGDVTLDNFKGSWAGAMGHTQFIPTTYQAYAVDGSGDAKRDIWNNPFDALASAAHYLKISGWKPDMPWGVEVTLPEGFNYSMADLSVKKPVSYWRNIGVRAKHKMLDRWGESALYLPAGHLGPAFLVTGNFFALMRYNVAPAYALSASFLSDLLMGAPPAFIAWPLNSRPLQPDEIREMQILLRLHKYDIGRIDGMRGKDTNKAVRQFQIDQNLVADGYATPDLLDYMRNITQAAQKK